MVPSSRSRQTRIISVTAAVLLNFSSVDAFSLVQNAAASQQSALERDASADGGSTSAGAASRGRSAASSAASAAADTPFRGSLNSRRQLQPSRKRQYQSASSSSDDFSLRMGNMQSDSEPELVEDHHYGANEKGSPSSSHHDDQKTSSSQSQPSDSRSTSVDNETKILQRRKFLHDMLVTTAAATAFTTISPIPGADVSAANAYDQAYPLELTSTPYNEVETSSNSLSKLKEERLSNKKAKVAATKSELFNDPLGLNQAPLSSNFGLTIAGASTWALALWFATGSRSNPVVKPLANVLYDEKNEDWLADRNEGYFAELPFSFMAILSAVFVFLGVIVDRAVYFLADGDAEVSLQLAGVSVIGGAVWEVGRLAAKEKAPTREEYDRDVVLYKEFDEFANKRLIVGQGSCHRSDVIRAFRRYNPKYRTADNEQYSLADIEIERILRKWNRQFGSGNEMTSAGFFSGITVDGEADAFAPR